MVNVRKRVPKKAKRVRKEVKAPGEKLGKLIPSLFAIGALIFLAFGIFYYYEVFSKPSNVFWGMIDNNLSTRGITRQVVQQGSDDSSNEYAQFNFGTPTAVKLIRVLTSNTDNNNFTKIEGIGMANADYQRYLEVGRSDESTESGFNQLIGKWVKTASTEEGSGQPPSILLRALLGPVLNGNLPSGVRKEVVNDIKNINVYTVNFDDVEKTKENGRPVYKFKAEINLKAFTTVMNKYATALGVPGADTINPDAYQESETIQVILSVDPRSRQLLKIDYADSGINETYGGYGVTSNIEPPSDYLSSEEFQQLISQ